MFVVESLGFGGVARAESGADVWDAAPPAARLVVAAVDQAGEQVPGPRGAHHHVDHLDVLDPLVVAHLGGAAGRHGHVKVQ